MISLRGMFGMEQAAIKATYSPDAQDVIDRYSSLTNTQKDAIAKLVDAEVSAGRWADTITVVVPSLGLEHWKLSKSAINNGATLGSHGAVFDGTNYIDLNFIPSTEGVLLNDIYYGTYIYENRSTADFKVLFGADSGANVLGTLTFQRATLNIMQAINQGSTSLIGGGRSGPYQNQELIGIARESSAYAKSFINGIQNGSDVAATSTGQTEKSLYLGAKNGNGVASSHIDATIPLWFASKSVGVNKQEQYNNYLTFLTEIGVFF